MIFRLCFAVVFATTVESYTDEHFVVPEEWKVDLDLEAEAVKQHQSGRTKHFTPVIIKSITITEFHEETTKELLVMDKDSAAIPVGVEWQRRKLQKGQAKASKRSLEATVNRWEHKVKIYAKDVDGCGTPICVNIDARPKRFESLCRFVSYLKTDCIKRQFYQIQKGDCADAIEGKGFDRVWGEMPKDECKTCLNNDICNTKICLGFNGKAKTFNCVCEAMKTLHDQKDVVLAYIAMGDCSEVFNPQSCLFTEWFDVDEPCLDGDSESAAQNLAAASTWSKSGRFRMCPKSRRKGDFEVETVEGDPVPKEQKVERDTKSHQFVCRNKWQTTKPGPPNLWFSSKILCRDYKMRHCCQCPYGCNGNPDSSGYWKMSMPDIKHMFDECVWQPFVSNEAPGEMDAEDRAGAIKYGQSKRVCGARRFNAMFIDARRREDDTPWDETGELITKNTPFYGFLCINENNKHFGKTCSDYKVRYCCLKERPAQWGRWSAWTECTKSCGGGTRKRNRVCVEKKGEKETCFGNWPAKGDKFRSLKEQVKHCNELQCPEDSAFTQWKAWEPCPLTCGKAKQRRRRGCNPAKAGGQECPTEREKYEEWQDCKLPHCADPVWTKWSAWSKCSLTCGVGKKRKTRECQDAITKQPMEPGFDCLGGGTSLAEDCKTKDCPIDGQWTEWLNWGECSVLCGDNGRQVRRRYCAQPLPQNGGKECDGENLEERKCEGLKPCPQHCEWSQWGSWCECSVTCGHPGEGMQTRGRHKRQEAKYGGRKCQGGNIENRVCLHEKMKSDKKEYKGVKPIYYCPVDCQWGDWKAWSECPECQGEVSGYDETALKEFEQMRTRRVKRRAKYRGKKCRKSVDIQTQKGKCLGKIPTCPESAAVPFVGSWTEWSPCFAPKCGKAEKGKRKRTRQCHSEEGKPCKGPLTQEEECPRLCPPIGWSQWENWSNCPVTCGNGQRARRRFCRDDDKDEMRGNSTCKGIGR